MPPSFFSPNIMPTPASTTPLPESGWSSYVLVALFSMLLALGAWGLRGTIPLLQSLEGLVMDAQQRIRGPITPGKQPEIAILLIDERSLEALGTLPIDRRALARTVDKLHADQAGWIVLDMLFVEHSRHDKTADGVLAESMRRAGNVVLPFAFLATGTAPDSKAIPNFIEDSAYLRYRNETLRDALPLQPNQLMSPIPVLGEAAAILGHVSVRPDHDGAVRYDMPAIWFNGDLFPSLPVRLSARILGQEWAQVEAALGAGLTLDSRFLPFDMLSRQWVNFYGPSNTFPIYSLHDYLSGKLPADTFRNRIVLIGGSILGNSDRYPSPFDPTLPGVERLATVLDNLLTGRWLSRPNWAAPAEILAMVLLPILAVALIRRFKPVVSLAILATLAFVLLLLAQLLFSHLGMFLSVPFPMIGLLLATGLGLSLRSRFDENSRREAERLLAISEERYALAARGANDGLWDWNISDDRAFFSQRWRELMEPGTLPLDENTLQAPSIGIAFWLNKLPTLESERFSRELDAHLLGKSQQFHHVFTIERDSDERWLLARGIAVREDGKPVRMAGSLTDITEQKRLEKQIAFDALHDRNTGLANRALFHAQLQQFLAREAGQDVPAVGLILADVDNFRAVNEKYGDAVGNNLLSEIAQRLQTFSHEGHIVARLGADQFALAFQGALDEGLAQRIRRLFDTPFLLACIAKPVSATVALAHTAQGLATASDLLNAVSLTLLHGKQQSRGTVRLFDAKEQATENKRLWLGENLDRAIATGDQFHLFYQPLVRLSDRKLLGFEALIRWQHPEHGMIMPNDFIPYAEESGHIIAIGSWTFREACRQLRLWHAMGFGGEIAVNLSGRQFAEADLEAEARTMLEILAPLSAHRIKLEVTESMSMAQPEKTAETLGKLTDMGFKIAIDDFGTGYSSLAYLHRFPFDTLKVDRSFVMRLGAGREAQEVVRTIVGLAQALDKVVLAEGVEYEDQAAILATLGVQVGQGWLFGKPLPVSQATERVVASINSARPEG